MKKLISTLFMMWLSCCIVIAQSYNQFYLGFAFPQAEFGEDDFDNGMNGTGQATTGLHLGFTHYKPLKINNLYMTFSVSAIYNELSRDFKDELEEQSGFEDYEDEYDLEITYPRYFNIPVLIGLNYQYQLQDDIVIYGEGNIGGNIFKTTNLDFSGKDDYGPVEYKSSFRTSYKFSYRYGVGLLYKDKYFLNLRYYNLGTHKTKYKISIDEYGDTDTDTGYFRSMDVGILSLSLGFKF